MPARMRAMIEGTQGAPADPSVIVMDIPMRAPLQNEWQRMHWSKRRKVCRLWAELIYQAYPRIPVRPLVKCRIKVERFSTQKPDRDGLYGGLKPLLDALQPASRRHPYGLGFIHDDNDECVVELAPIHVQSGAQRTRITIEPL